jgi:hypothetical protein
MSANARAPTPAPLATPEWQRYYDMMLDERMGNETQISVTERIVLPRITRTTYSQLAPAPVMSPKEAE